MESTNVELKLYPSINGYIGKINLSKNLLVSTTSGSQSNDNIDSVIILDRSGSMGANVERIGKIILPAFLKGLGYTTQKVTLITFDSEVAMFQESADGFEKLHLQCRGCTQMSPAVDKLRQVLTSVQSKSLRILAISDGMLDDQQETLKNASTLASEISGRLTVNAQAVRFFTSGSQPDTRGLSSILQLNSVGQANLVDIEGTHDNDFIIGTLISLYDQDHLGMCAKVSCSKSLLMSSPWSDITDNTPLYEGENILWFKDIPDELYLTLSNGEKTKIQITQAEDITLGNYEAVLETKINYYLNQLKILKVVNTTNSINEVKNIVQYFADFEKSLELRDSDNIKVLNSTGLRSRIEYFKNIIRKRTRSVANRMSQIANDDRVNQLNAAQQAEYLRSIDVINRTSKGLAKRALNEGIDFDAVARNEVLEMSKHIDELKDIDDSSHTVSFYSTCTTLDGIKTTCELVSNNMLEEMDANDIIKMLNIVGIGCDSPVGDFPDPMTWRVNNIYIGCYVSLSDVLMAYEVSGGKALKDVNTKLDIINVIPFYDDERIHKFLLHYAPTLLEYSASIGMRRMLAHVPYTYSYTIVSGAWKMVQCLDKLKSDINVNTFSKLIKSYEIACGKHFDYVLDLITEQDELMSYYIANNGVTNMFSPLIKLARSKNIQFMPRILRNLYAFEVYQYTRKLFRSSDNPVTYATQVLNELLGVDFEKYATPMPALFEPNPNPQFYDQYHVNEEKLDEITKGCWWVDYLTLLPDYLLGSFESDPISAIKSVPELSADTISKALDLKYDLKTFKLFNVVQGFFFREKAQRVDDEAKKMKIIDLGNFEKADEFLKGYVKGQYSAKYQTDYQIQLKAERQQVVDDLIGYMTGCEYVEEYAKYFKEGFTKGTINHLISDTSKLGYVQLKENLLNMKVNVPQRCQKLSMLLLGIDTDGNIIWNNGNVLRTPLNEFEAVFLQLNEADLWAKVKDIYKKKNLHVYRNEHANRQGHSNEKPSYWANGYPTLEDMGKNLPSEDMSQYETIHYNCCGIAQKTGVTSYKQEKKDKKKELRKQWNVAHRGTNPKGKGRGKK